MNFGNMGFMEILVILLLVLLLFGAKRLPEIGHSMGKGIREFKRSISDMDRSISEPSREERLGSEERPRGDERLRGGEPIRERGDEAPRHDPKRLIG